MKRGGIKVSTFMISMLVMSLLIVTFSNFFAAVGSQYGVSYDNDTNESIAVYNQFNSIQNTTEKIEENLFSSSDGDNTDLLGTFLGAGFNVLKLAKESTKAFGVMVNSAAEQIGLPASFSSIILTIVALLIIFAIIGVLVGKDI